MNTAVEKSELCICRVPDSFPFYGFRTVLHAPWRPRATPAWAPRMNTKNDTRFTNRACHPVAGYAATRMCAGSKCINHRHDHADTDIAASLAMTSPRPPPRHASGARPIAATNTVHGFWLP